MSEKKEKKELERRMSETANPFGMMRRFTKDMEKLFDDFGGSRVSNLFRNDFSPFQMESERFEWIPQIEVLQNNGQFTVRADLPGLTKNDVKVEITDKMLILSGERKEEKEEKHEDFYRSERSYGSFYRQIPLPEGAKNEKAEATFDKGVLAVTMPAHKVETEMRKLEVKDMPVEKHQAKAAA